MRNNRLKLIASLSMMLLTAACASTGSNPADPYEDFNRATFKFNTAVDKAVLRPVSTAYRTVVPKTPRKAVRNFFRNLREPLVLMNDILQGELGRASKTFQRFVVNSTVGVGGLLNMAPKAGLEYHSEDFGQTLAVWGIGDGNFIVLPFLGPSTTRDAFGTGVDFVANPATHVAAGMNEKGLQLGLAAGEFLDLRARAHDTLEALYAEEDPYILMRSSYLQNRKFEIKNGEIERDTGEDDLFDELEDETDGEDGSN